MEWFRKSKSGIEPREKKNIPEGLWTKCKSCGEIVYSKKMEELPSYLYAFDVAINPQKLNEVTIGNYPRKIDEYLAMGKPIVSARSLGYREMFGESILYFEPEDVTSLYNSIKEALRGGRPVNDRIKKAQSIIKIYRWENIVKHEEKVMKVLVKGDKRDFSDFDWNLTYKH